MRLKNTVCLCGKITLVDTVVMTLQASNLSFVYSINNTLLSCAVSGEARCRPVCGE